MSRIIAVLLAGIFLTGFYGGIAFAEDKAQLQQLLNRTETLEKENDALKERLNTIEKAQQQSHAASKTSTLPPAQPNLDGTGFFASANYNFRKLNNGSGINTGWESGFRASIGYRIPDDGLDVLVRYNYFRASENDVVTGYIISPSTTSVFTSSIKYSIDEAVIEVGDRFKLTNSLNLRLYIGAQYARIKEKRFSDSSDFCSVFEGYGLRIGEECNFNLGKGFSLNSGISGGFVVGESEWHREYSFIPVYSYSQETDDVMSLFAADIGLVYDIMLSRSANLDITLGYEFNEYFNLSYIGDIILHGPYFRARLDF